MLNLKNSNTIKVKVAGGLTSQLLGLLSAIYLSQKHSTPFKLLYYPYSTGTYWPLEIEKLLSTNEIEIVNNHGSIHSQLPDLEPNIRSSKLFRINAGYGVMSQKFQIGKFRTFIKRLTGEYIVAGEIDNLVRIGKKVRSVTGVYPPIAELSAINELSLRIDQAGILNPFGKMSNSENKIVLHYRLGDFRKRRSSDDRIGGHGVVDPVVFKEMFDYTKSIHLVDEIQVISDEPTIAIRLLKEVGLDKLVAASSEDPWKDLKTAASGRYFFGSMSQFSLFCSLLCHLNGGISFLPLKNDAFGSKNMNYRIDSFRYFDYRFLEKKHWIFQN
jgi:hypothetical protein